MDTIPLNSSPAQRLLPYLFLVLAVFAAYANVYENVLLFDDNIVITLNEWLRSWRTFPQLLTSSSTGGAHIAGGFYRPMQNVLYFFIYQLSGDDPFLFHLLNVSLHATNACLAFCLAQRLGFRLWPSFLGALIWSLHPLHTEVITYVSGTAEPLFTFFCLLGLLLVVPTFGFTRILAALPLLLLALFSKEAAVVFPALVVTCIYVLAPGRLGAKTYLRTWPLWLVALIYVYWRWTAPGFDGPQTYGKVYQQHDFYNLQLYSDHLSYRIYTCLATLPAYLRLLLWPTGLHMERTFPVFVSLNSRVVWEGIVLCAAAAAQIVWKREHRSRPLSWGLLWFAAAHAPNTGIIFSMNSQFLEHWMYLPSLGLIIGGAESLSRVPMALLARRLATGLAILLAVILGGLTFEQNAVWHDPFVFYGNIFKYGEPSARGHNNLALAFMDKGDYPAAIAEFKKAISMTDTYAETRHNLALAILHLPNPESHIPEAIENLNRALEIDPQFYRSWDALAIIYEHIGDPENEARCRRMVEEIRRPHNR
ncbi:MAG: hypothetical protein M3N08_05495 [Pseudomonadota bacterium]|nr:hypothetical protein [Pseudomonadota bacterium]